MLLLLMAIIGIIIAIVLVIGMGIFLFPVTGIGFVLLIAWLIYRRRHRQ